MISGFDRVSTVPVISPVEWLALLALVGTLMAFLRFAITRYIKSADDNQKALTSSMTGLHDSVDALTLAIRDLREEMLEKFVTKEDHRRDLDLIRAGFFGRRAGDTCTLQDCPAKKDAEE